jgi:hypothetical protein
LHRIHRKPLDRLANILAVPVHRYMCTNKACRWSGLRVDAGHHQGPVVEAEAGEM